MFDEKLRELQDRLLEINERVQTIQATADAENRALSEDEEKEINSAIAKFEAIEAEIERRKIIMDQTTKLMQSQGRKADLQEPEPQNRQETDDIVQTRRQSRRPSIQVIEDRGKWGWKHMGEFALAVRIASKQGGHIDPRLVMNAPTLYSSESVGSEGGFAVPPDFRAEIWKKVAGEDSLLAKTDLNITSKNTIVFPADETTPWDSSGGIQAYWESEAGQKNQSKIALKEKTIRLNKLTALIPVTEELLEDATGLDGYLRKKVAEKFDFKINLKIVQGNGTGEPLGILRAPSLVTVSKESGQAADTVKVENIVKMYSAMYAPCRKNAVWLINQDVEPQLNMMKMEGSAGGVFPVFLPPGGLSAAPYGTLMGRPVIPTQACETVGDFGDIIFVDLSQYLMAVKGGGIKTDVSIHLWFDYDMVAYRFVMRIAGMPWWATRVTPRDGTNYLSWAVALEERA